MDKEFYERVIVAKAIQECTGSTLNDAFQFIEMKGDSELSDTVWLKIVGDNVTWENHLFIVCASILKLGVAQPSCDPFSVTEASLELNKEYNEWYVNVWRPYLWSLILKYEDVIKTRLNSKTQRGAKNYLKEMYSKYEVLNITLPTV